MQKLFGDVATYQATSVALRNYAVGDFMIYNNYFYEVTQAISAGGTITDGTNITQTTIGAVLASLGADVDAVDGKFTNLLTSTITAGNTSVTISDASITTSSIIDIYFENKVLAPTDVTVTTGSITIEIAAQDSNVNVGVRVL